MRAKVLEFDCAAAKTVKRPEYLSVKSNYTKMLTALVEKRPLTSDVSVRENGVTRKIKAKEPVPVPCPPDNNLQGNFHRSVARLGTPADKDQLFDLIDASCAAQGGSMKPENFKAIAGPVLDDVDNGFFIVAEDSGKLVGMMYFSYEWSDWRDCVFFWMQAAFAVGNDEKVHETMLAFLDTYQKERGCAGFRLCSETASEPYWQPVIARMKLTKSHYYIYDVDTSGAGGPDEKVKERKGDDEPSNDSPTWHWYAVIGAATAVLIAGFAYKRFYLHK